MSGVINMLKDTLSSAKKLYTVLLVLIIAFVGYHFMYDFGLKAYKRYYGVEGFDTAETPSAEQQNVLNDATHRRAGANSITTNDLQQSGANVQIPTNGLMLNEGDSFVYKMKTSDAKPDLCAAGSGANMIWTGQVCGEGKIMWYEMATYKDDDSIMTNSNNVPCVWKRSDSHNIDWYTKYLGSCGVSPSYITMPTKVSELNANSVAVTPIGYSLMGISECADWDKNYIACATALDGTKCNITATTLKECANACNSKKGECNEMYFKDGKCFLAAGKCKAMNTPTNPKPHYLQKLDQSANVWKSRDANLYNLVHSSQQVPTTDTSNDDASIGGMGNQVTKVYSPGNAVGNTDNNGVPSDSVASNASGSLDSPNLVYSIGNETAGLYPSNNNLNNIQGGNPQNVAGSNTTMQPSPIAPISNDSAANENNMIAQKNMGIFDEDEKDASINVSLNIKMSEHVGKMIASSIPQYTNPQQYASGRTTGILPQGSGYYGEMPVESLGTTYDNRLGGNYPSYDYNKNNNAGTAYTNMYKPVNPQAKPAAYNSLMDLFK